MDSRVRRGSFAHVVGKIDLDRHEGSIDYVTPVEIATFSDSIRNEGILLSGEDFAGNELFSIPVRLRRNSCEPHSMYGTFDEFIPVTPQLSTIRLELQAVTLAQYSQPQQDNAVFPIALAGADPTQPNKMLLASEAQPATGASYTVQARADTTANWMTLAVGRSSPDATIDINQFPGAKSVNIRVLKTEGFSETEVFNETKTF